MARRDVYCYVPKKAQVAFVEPKISVFIYFFKFVNIDFKNSVKKI